MENIIKLLCNIFKYKQNKQQNKQQNIYIILNEITNGNNFKNNDVGFFILLYVPFLTFARI